jgi:CubicO group peptidase (beta-lactamase class C family)
LNRADIQSVLEGAVAAGAAAGVTAAVTGPQGTLLTVSAGVTAAGGAQPVGPDTLFWIASMTKPITSVAAMQLVEQGRLELDMPIGALLPELQQSRILEGGKFRPATRQITLRQLLTHTSGYSYAFASKEYADYIAAHPELPHPSTRAGLDAPLLFEPGERWEYGISTDWVGLAVEAASGQRLDAYFNDHILGPLGMRDTSFTPTEAQFANAAAMHQRLPDGSLRPKPAGPQKPPEVLSGGGGLFSTLNDYLKFLRMFLNQGGGILSPASVAEMSRNQIGTLRAGYIPSANPTLFLGADVNPGMESKWGLGFLIYPENGRFGRRAGSLSWAGMANTYFWIDPQANLAAAMMMQLLPSGDPSAIKTMIGFERAIYAAAR